MKKTITLIFSVLVLALCLSFTGFAGNIDEEFPLYSAGQNGKLSWSYSDGTLKITGNDMMEEFCVWGDDAEHPEWYMTETNAPWRAYRKLVKTIIIGDDVQSIGWYAFFNFENLETVYIPHKMGEIQNGAFEKCGKLKTVNLATSKAVMPNLCINDSDDSNKPLMDAKWNTYTPYVDGYTVTYVFNGGKNNSKNVATHKANTAVTLYNPTRTGYTFGGWYTDSSFKTKITEIKASSNKNYTLYAKWTANTYTIKFNPNGGTGTMSNLAMKYGTEKKLTANAYKKTNYTFTGWNTKSDGSGTTYKNSASVKNLTATKGATVTLYAQWKKTTYTIAFDGNGATSGSTASIKAYLGKSYTLTANGFKRNCYTFTGWNTKADGSGTKYANKASVKNLKTTDGAKITLYAQWKLNANCYTIKYNLNGGKNSSSNPLAYSKTGKTITLATPTKTGYSFGGWYSDSKLTKKVTAIKSGSTGNKVFYAKWTAISYTVSFNGNGSTSGSMSAMKCEYTKTYTLTANAFKKSGYTFGGWNTKADGTGTSYENKAKIKNLSSKNGAKITLYAQWLKPEISDTDGNIKWSIYSNGLLTLSGTGTMYNYTVITTTTQFGSFRTSTAPWASRGTGTRDKVKSAKIGSGITNIGVAAFVDCYNMTEITIPTSVTTIGKGAFLGCTNLKDVYYAGSKADWEKISINDDFGYNDVLDNVTMHYGK